MIRGLRQLAEQAALSLVSAVLFVSFFEINNWLFASLEYTQGVSWVFLPAGFRVILVLAFGLPGALGLVMGSWFIDSETLLSSSWFFPFLNGVVSGLTPWLVMKYLNRLGLPGLQLQTMTAQGLLQLTLIFSAASAFGHQLVWWLFERPGANIWVDVWPMFIGNVLGALLMLYGMKWVLNAWQLGRSTHSD